jgi:hypothetical protein
MFERAVAITGTVAMAVATLAMLVSNRMGDRVQSVLTWLVLLLVGVTFTAGSC